MPSANKREVVEQMLAKGDTMICLDSRHPDVQVPENHQGKEDLRLVLNLNFRHKITTLSEGIQAELLFGGVPFLCWIPYQSLWAVYNPQTGEGHLWPGETPVRLYDLLGDESEEYEEKEETKRGESGKTALAADRPEEAMGQAKTARARKSRESGSRERPLLRVIKGGKKG